MATWLTRVPGEFYDADLTQRFHFTPGTGNLATGTKTGSIQYTNDFSVPLTIVGVRATVVTAPTGAAAIFDVNVDGTTIFTTQANRPTIAIAGTTSGNVTNMDVTTLPAGSTLTIDTDQIGSGTAGAGLTVVVLARVGN